MPRRKRDRPKKQRPKEGIKEKILKILNGAKQAYDTFQKVRTKHEEDELRRLRLELKRLKKQQQLEAMREKLMELKQRKLENKFKGNPLFSFGPSKEKNPLFSGPSFGGDPEFLSRLSPSFLQPKRKKRR